MSLRRIHLAIFAAALAAASPVRAQVYPSKPVRLIVPFAAGGTTDAVARIVADKLSGRIGQPMVVDNRPGADSIIGFDAVAKASPDGYAVLLNTSSALTLLPHTRRSLPFDPASFVHIAQLADVQFVFAVNPSFPASDVAAMITLSRSKPGKFSYASASEQAHITVEMLKLETGADLLHVPYKVGTQATADLLSNRIDMLVVTFAPVISHLRSGKLKALAVAGDRRSPSLPDVPTIRESGIREFESSGLYGLSGPAGTPSAVVKKLGDEALAVMQLAEVAEKMLVIGTDPRPATGEQYAGRLRDEYEKWRSVVKRIGFKPE